jgi:hypothetical protein
LVDKKNDLKGFKTAAKGIFKFLKKITFKNDKHFPKRILNKIPKLKKKRQNQPRKGKQET